MEITNRQLEIMQHCLGLDQYGRAPRQRHPDGRNHFCAGTSDEPICRELVVMGLMAHHAKTSWLPYFNCSVTDAGKEVVRDKSPTPPKVSRSAKRFAEYRSYSDCNECTFREWLDIRNQDWYREMMGRAY